MGALEIILPSIPSVAALGGLIVLWRKSKPETEKLEAEAEVLVINAAKDFGVGAYARLDRVEDVLDKLEERVRRHSRWHVVYDHPIQTLAAAAGVVIPPAPPLEDTEGTPA